MSSECRAIQEHNFQAWLAFKNDGPAGVNPGDVRKEIVESWLRCRHADVPADREYIHASLDAAGMQMMLQQNKRLIAVAKPFMQNLYKIVAGSGFVVALTDTRGYIMEIFGDQDTLTNPMTASFFCGADWSESAAGTNAIGTALILQRPIQVSGSEHYCRMHHCLTCSAAPVLDVSGRLLGVLDVSGEATAAHLHTLGMVVAAAEAIMAQLDIREKNNVLSVVNKRLTNIFNTMSDGVIMIDESGVISEMNPVAMNILGTDSAVRVGMPVETAFGDRYQCIKKMLKKKESFVDTELILNIGKEMCHFLASGTPVTDEKGADSGGVIVLRSIQQVQRLVNRFSGHYSTLQFSDIVGESRSILEAIRIAALAAGSMSNVLLQGESGTGKEIFAQAIHNRSERAGGPFIAVNCGAIPRELIGSELFGYGEGAFTGAKRGGKPGKFELAGGGTLFLDEIGDMPLEQQVALLRVLQERKVLRIGCDKEIPIDVRVICATNKNLFMEVEKGTFRKDLYYRLNVISITIPPLRQRSEDIALLFRYFLEKLDKHMRGFMVEPAVIEQITRYDWPGNVRELQNVVERIVSLTEGRQVALENLPREIREWKPAESQKTACGLAIGNENASAPILGRQRKTWLAEEERQEILALLSDYRGNVSLTARSMGISRNTLYRKMKQYAIDG